MCVKECKIKNWKKKNLKKKEQRARNVLVLLNKIMAKNIQNTTQNYGRNINSVSSDLRSNGYLKNNELLFSIERAISTTTTQNANIGDFDAQTNRSDSIFKGSVTTATSIQSIKNYTKESQKLKPFFSDEILEWSEVVLVLVLILLIVITVIGK